MKIGIQQIEGNLDFPKRCYTQGPKNLPAVTVEGLKNCLPLQRTCPFYIQNVAPNPKCQGFCTSKFEG